MSPAEAILPAECIKSNPPNNIQRTAEMNWQSHVSKSHLASCEIQDATDWLIAEKSCQCEKKNVFSERECSSSLLW